jgi:hypothetical protein
MRKFWQKQGKHEEREDITVHAPKLAEAIRSNQKPLAFGGKDVEAARKIEEARDIPVSNRGRGAMLRDRKVHRDAMSHKQDGFHSQKKNEKRKGNRRNHVEERTINRLSR